MGWKVGTHIIYHHTNGSRFEGVEIEGMIGIVVCEDGAVLWQDGEVRTPLPWNIEPLDEVKDGKIVSYHVMTPIDNKFMPKPKIMTKE